MLHTIKKKMGLFLLSALTSLLMAGWFSPILSRAVAALPFSPVVGQAFSQNTADFALATALEANVTRARSVLLTQGAAPSDLMTYVAVMNGANVVPKSANTLARGAVGAVLSGDRLVVRGSFGHLSSPLRDYATDPVDPPNPSITSAFHIHQGDPSENGPFQYALDVMIDAPGRGGSAMGEYTLTAEQVQALAAGRLYVDLHTTQNRGGELRAILMPY
ncbi:MAG: CHRD domain-containing protein [Nodosilinea sp.]